MKIVSYANRSLVMSATDADMLIEYARLVGLYHRTDAVRMRAVSSSGQEVEATFLLNGATSLLIETAPETESVAEPDNTATRMYLLDRILTLSGDFDRSAEGSW